MASDEDLASRLQFEAGTVCVAQNFWDCWSAHDEIAGVFASKEDAEKALPEESVVFGDEFRVLERKIR
ncbi:hypothetical protein DFJ74DRAFT_714379 [Hyaloraphidium curvatum]|nr:hypothetical protein DFJ74DRAFT_714379 [Hyaloraphidium curvatum]